MVITVIAPVAAAGVDMAFVTRAALAPASTKSKSPCLKKKKETKKRKLSSSSSSSSSPAEKASKADRKAEANQTEDRLMAEMHKMRAELARRTAEPTTPKRPLRGIRKCSGLPRYTRTCSLCARSCVMGRRYTSWMLRESMDGKTFRSSCRSTLHRLSRSTWRQRFLHPRCPGPRQRSLRQLLH